jgi:Ca2+/Na+ antiporter
VAGINLAFAAISFFLASRKIDTRTYLFFGAFSLFSACYFLFPVIHLAGIWMILAAAIYYAFFAWFVFDFSESKSIILPSLISATLLVAFTLLAFNGPQ